MKPLLKYNDFVNLILESKTLNEGGAYGHLNHPFDDLDLTFADLQEMLDATINGAFGPENFVSEKTDGQNIMVSWKGGRLIAARNKSHLKNQGANALSAEALAQMFAGRGEIEIAFTTAMDDLSSAIAAFSPQDKDRFFAEGKKFASVEVITPKTQNVVPYGLKMLVFHGTMEYDEDGNPIGEDKQAGRDLGKIVNDINVAVQKNFFIRGPHDLEIKPLPNTKAREAYYRKKIDTVMKESGCSPSSTVGDYVIGMATNIFKRETNKAGITIPFDVETKLIRRIASIDDSKTYTISQIKKDLGSDASWFIDLEKKDFKKIQREIYAPLENIFLEIGTEMMKNMSSFLSANPTQAAEEMKAEIDRVISSIRTNGDASDVEKLEHELNRIATSGGLESIVPTEGITFLFKGKLYKYTGIFAPINQIRGMLTYR
jgi:hypothetical protein